MLLDKHQVRVGKETLRRWMMAEGMWLSRTQRRTFHQSRLRRECVDELVRITQFGRAFGELDIEILCANSSQARVVSSG